MTIATLVSVSPLLAQTSPSSQNQGRDCITVRTCNFVRGAEVRGCLSSYTCRTCRVVPARCTIGSAQGTCSRVRCTWGG